MLPRTPTESAIARNSAATQAHLFARQPLSVSGKLAVGGFLAGTILCGIVTLILTIATGAPSRDIIVTTACMLVATFLSATGFRWAPVLGSLLGSYLLFSIITEPFVSESLGDPKGPNGGLGHFVGDVIIIAYTLVAVGASIPAAVRNYHQQDQQDAPSPRWLSAALGLVAGIVLGAIFIGAMAEPPVAASATTTFTNGVPTVHLSAGGFAQPSVTIPIGSKLLLVNDTPVLHVLANGSWQRGVAKPGREPGAPVVNAVQLGGNNTETGPFPTAGTYHIFCVVHLGMNLSIIVE